MIKSFIMKGNIIMEKNWKERAKTLMDNDFFVDFDEPTKEDFVPADTTDFEESFYRYDYDLTEDKISEEDLYKALVTDGELVSLNAGNTGEAVSFKDGGVYCDTTYEITEYDGKFSVTEFFNSDDGDWKEGAYYFETDSFESLCAELERLFPGALVECKMTEDTHAKYAKPEGDRVASYNNALKYAKKEGKPYIYGYLNNTGKFFALEQPIKVTGDQVEKEKEFRKQYINCKTMYVAYPDKNFMEEIELTADELKDKYGTDNVELINAGKEPEERVALKEAVEVVYAWKIQNDIYGVDWCSVEESDSEPGLYDGVVFLTASEAKNAAVIHLRELEEEGELEGEPSDYYVGAIDYPTGIISDETLEFSNIITEALNELNEGGQTPEAKAWQDANCYKWNAYAVINGKRKSVACTYEPKEINSDTLIASVRRIAAHKLNLIMAECFFLKKPFAWDGNLEITRTEFGAEPEYITTIQIKRQGDRDLSQIPEL